MPRANIPQSQVQFNAPDVGRIDPNSLTGAGQATVEMAKQLESINQHFKKVRNFRNESLETIGLNEEISNIQSEAELDDDPNNFSLYQQKVDKAVAQRTSNIVDPALRLEVSNKFSTSGLNAKAKLGTAMNAKLAKQAQGAFYGQASSNAEEAIKTNDPAELQAISIKAINEATEAVKNGVINPKEGQGFIDVAKGGWASEKTRHNTQQAGLLKVQQQEEKNKISLNQNVNGLSLYNDIANAQTLDQKQELLNQIEAREGMESFNPSESITSAIAADLKKLIFLPTDDKASAKEQSITMSKVNSELLVLFEQGEDASLDDVNKFINSTSALSGAGKIGDVSGVLSDALVVQEAIVEKKAIDKIRANRLHPLRFIRNIFPENATEVEELKGKIIEEYYSTLKDEEDPIKAYEKSVLEVMAPVNPFFNVFKDKKVNDNVVMPDGREVVYKGFNNGQIQIEIK